MGRVVGLMQVPDEKPPTPSRFPSANPTCMMHPGPQTLELDTWYDGYHRQPIEEYNRC